VSQGVQAIHSRAPGATAPVMAGGVVCVSGCASNPFAGSSGDGPCNGGRGGVWCEPQVLLAKSQTVRSSFLRKEGLILPGRVRTRPEILARTFRAERYAASVVRQRAAAKGPGKDRAGGVAFQPRAGARRSHMLKHWTGGLRRGPIRLASRTRGVIGGVTCSQGPITLTGESPTPFQVLLDTPGR
jgi:hypothetical protein